MCIIFLYLPGTVRKICFTHFARIHASLCGEMQECVFLHAVCKNMHATVNNSWGPHNEEVWGEHVSYPEGTRDVDDIYAHHVYIFTHRVYIVTRESVKTYTHYILYAPCVKLYAPCV